ncbi:AGAP008735-PA-like protein [Anopheles sinensis]|uniref:AGAP008735-PA-like protein n=1 Tax=Anopheles sinensis TaxID=74873 RepID=A0A084VML2_ANOSI|nr:AGAP008735-PA-like protein [Anopheles sinensis]
MESAEENIRAALQEQKNKFLALHPVFASKGFTLDEPIGYGSFSVVKRGYDSTRKRVVAVKILSKRSQATSKLLTKFIPREKDIIREVRHANIIRFYDFIETTSRIYIVMEYAENGSLLNLLKKQKWLPEGKAQAYFRQLAEAVEYLHKCGIAHRDIKPENIVLDASDTVKLIDFGFACRVSKVEDEEELPLSNTFCGSYMYASPELLQCKPYAPQPCDIWASGIVLYMMLFGRSPFSSGKNAADQLKMISVTVAFPANIMVSQEVKNLIKQIFVPAEKRIDATSMLKCDWLQKKNEKINTKR